MVSCILTMIIMYKFNYTNETVSGLLRDEIHIPIYKKNLWCFKVQIMIEMYICTSRFDNLRQGMHLLLENDKNQGKAVSFLTFLLNFRCIITMLLSL